MSCRHDLANGTCIRCYPGNPDGRSERDRTDPGPDSHYGPNMEGPGAIPADKPSIAELQRIEARMERAPWDCTTPHVVSNPEYDLGRFDGPADAIGTAALRNAAPVLLEIVAAALAWDAAEAPTPEGDHAYQCFMAALAKVRP